MRNLIAALSRYWAAWKKIGEDIIDVFKPKGYVELRLCYAHGPKKGQVSRIIKGRNVVTNFLGGTGLSGRDMMRRLLIPSGFGTSLSGDTTKVIGQIALGSGTTAEAASDEDLVAEIGSTRKAVTEVTLDGSNTYVTFIVDYDEGEANTTISEAGLFSDDTPVDFIARKTFGSFTKTPDFTLQLRWILKF